MNQSAVDYYAREFAGLNLDTSEWLSAVRHTAFEAFHSTGFPTLRHEDWKYTDVRPIIKRQFSASLDSDGVDHESVSAAGFAGMGCHELVFTNGHYSKRLSTHLSLPDGVIVKPMREALSSHKDLMQEYLNRYVAGKSAFVSLNTAFITDGVFIHIPDGVSLEHPVNLLFLAGTRQQPFAAHVRNLIILGDNARATVIETYSGAQDAEYFTNAVTEIYTSLGASLEYYKLQQESLRAYHIAYQYLRQDRDSRIESHSISLGGALARNDIHGDLAAPGASLELSGLYLAGGRQHVDNHTRIDHLQPNTSSKENYRGVLDGHARGVFNGKVVVHQDAQKTDAHQANANLLLSDNAEVDTKPELEIYADDVKCSHGATVGQLDDAMLFYLRSRAIDAETARSLLTFAFADEVISHIRFEAVRKRLESVVVGKLPDTDIIKEFVQ